MCTKEGNIIICTAHGIVGVSIGIIKLIYYFQCLE